MEDFTATYSPDDNKLRLYSVHRLGAETYAQAKAAGFKWAPKQELFVAPMWTPQREDFLLSLVDEIGDEDTSLTDRAEERAGRFEDYSEKRADDAERAHKSVSSICDGIPLGQPILVGHHSEKHARKHAEKIEKGMRQAVKMWETSQYWERRAAGALRHAKYKELPAVRARRIKTIEADKRRYERDLAHAEKGLKLWSKPDLSQEVAVVISGVYSFTMPRKEGDREDFNQSPDAWTALNSYYPNLYAPRTLAEVIERAKQFFPANIAHYKRWIAHFENRLIYETAMLGEQGALDLIAPKARPKQLPLLNYRAPEGLKIENLYHRGEYIHYAQIEMTKAEYAKLWADDKATREIDKTHRVRVAIMRGANYSSTFNVVFLTDSKEVKPPEKLEVKAKEIELPSAPTTKLYQAPKPTKFDALKEQLKTGVQVAVANQLFPTPKELAERMARELDVQPGHRVLEPSAGTGVLLGALGGRMFGAEIDRESVVAVEINQKLADKLEQDFPLTKVYQGDFLEQNGNLGTFDRIIMNPPFENGVDIKHVKHAVAMLRPGGKLVAICAGGPRQQKEFEPLATSWEQLPQGTFANSGTQVNTVLLVINKNL